MACSHSKMGGVVVHICGPDAFGSTVIAGKTWRWDFHEHMGPCFLKQNGDPLKNQPGENHPVWDHFAEWLKDYYTKKEKRKQSGKGETK